ncbi:uncharacterized protein ACWYII_020256 [Salvelinus alpinus]
MSEKKMSSSRKHHLKSLMLQIAQELIAEEEAQSLEDRKQYMSENIAPLQLTGSIAELQDLCKKMHQKIDVIDEERYDLGSKVGKSDREIEDLQIKVQDLKGKFKKPVLKKVRMSADAMLQALLGSKHKVSMDLRSNLKQVKKEVKEEDKESVGDWRKNIEDKSDRKKMFETNKETLPFCFSAELSKSVPVSVLPVVLIPISFTCIFTGLAGSKTKRPAKMSDKKMSTSRRNYLKSLMLQIAAGLLEAEEVEAEAEKARYMEENCPAPELLVCMAELTDLCKKLHQKIERVDEERYDMSTKVTKSEKEVEDLKMKVVELNGKFRKPVLKRVRMSADAMLQALLGSKHKVSMDLRSNLKQVKKEVKEEDKESVGDWRKNIEDKSDRKKMFETHKE